MVKKIGLVVAMLAAVCCGGLLAGCANADGEENDSDYDYEEKKLLDYWNKDYNADDFTWEDITDDNRNKIVGAWKTVYECTKEALDKVNTEEGKEFLAGEIGYYVSMEFVIDNSFENCKFTFVDDSSKCKSKRHYYTPWQDSNGNISYGGAKVAFLEEFDARGYGFDFKFDDKNYIATATAENLSLKQLVEVLRCEGFSINTTENRLLLRNRSDDTQDHPATWIFSALDGSTGYVIARAK